MSTIQAREQGSYETAEKVASSAYRGPVFWREGPPSREGFTGEGFYASIADLLDTCAAEGEEPPAYVWACHKDVPSTTADRVIEEALEEHHNGARDYITPEHAAKLDAFLSEWWAESGAGTWRPDYGRAVVLPVNGDAEADPVKHHAGHPGHENR